MQPLTCGHAIHGGAQTHYCDYLHLSELLALQPSAEEVRHPDEHLFVVTHQAFELWFAQLRFDIPRLIAALDGDDVPLASWLVKRMNAIVALLPPMMRVLETMTPSDFYAFRAHLSPASGTESSQWQEIELLFGMRDPHFRRHLESGVRDADGQKVLTELWSEAMAALWEAPSVASAFDALLARRALDAADLYRVAPEANPHGDLVLLAEALLDLDESWRVWRFVHARTAERAIGSNPGTGNTTGVRYLDHAATHRPHFFPALWAARQTLWERASAASTG